MKLPGLIIKNVRLRYPIVQGGMGAGVSLHKLAGAVSKAGGLGTIASVGLRTIVKIRDGISADTIIYKQAFENLSQDLKREPFLKEVENYVAVYTEIKKAKAFCNGGPIAINVMCAIVYDYQSTICASIDAEVDAIISGAGLPLGLPSIKTPGHTALIPIISSARALEIIVKRWERVQYQPDAVVLEGPLAGGHLGFDVKDIENPEFALEKLLPPVLEVANDKFPVIVAGGIYTHDDIVRFLKMGARGVQMGTRFLTTPESDATPTYKQAVISAKVEDILVVAHPTVCPASPSGLPFRLLKTSPMYYKDYVSKCCNQGYLLRPSPKGPFCSAMPKNPDCKFYLSMCNGLLASCGYEPNEPELYTVGTNAYRVDKILSVKELMSELCGEKT